MTKAMSTVFSDDVTTSAPEKGCIAADKVSVLIPARNEAATIGALIQRIRAVMPTSEIVVTDDGSDDGTGAIATSLGASVIRHPVALGNGAAVKSAVRRARGDIVVMLDADGQHDPTDIPRLLAQLDAGYDLVVGARDASSQANIWRGLGNWMYNRLASWMVGHKIPDLTSGYRAARTARFREFLSLLPNGFSYPTTSTMAFFRAGYPVTFVPIRAARREGKSHIKLLRDGGRFFLIIFRVGTLYSPLKIFGPISAILFATGCWYYVYTLTTSGRFTNAGAVLFMTSILVFLIGLVSEQITTLIYLSASSGGVSRKG